MTSEGPHHPGQEPDEVSPGAGGSAPYGDRSAQQEHGYGTTAPDLGWAPPPPAARPNSPAPAWSAPGEAPPTVGWKAPGEPQPGPWGPPAGQGQPWGGPAGPVQPGTWNPQADQQQPTTAWAAASVPQPPPRGEAPQGGGQPGWGTQGESAPQNWPGPGTTQQPWPAPGEQPPARSPQQPAPWGSAGDQPPAAGWSPQGTLPQPATWDPPNEQPAEWAPQGDQPQPDAWGAAPVPQPGEQPPVARGAASVRPHGDPQPAAWGAAPAPQPINQQPQPWTPADEQPPTAAWGAASVPQQAEPQQSGWDTPGDQSRPTEAWPPAEPPAPPARATASVGRADVPAWGPGGARPGDDAVPARPVVPEGEPWSADEVWGKAGGADPAQAEPAGSNWDPSRAENPPMYQPAPGPGISPANAVPLPPQEARVPGASLAASPPADYAPPAPFAAPADQPPYGEQAGRDGGYDAPQPGDGWGAEAAQASAPAIPHPRTSPEPTGGDAGGSVSASASVPVSSRVMPPADQALHQPSMPAPQPRVYGRPARPADGPDQINHGGQPEPHRFGPDGEAGGRFDGEPESRFDSGPGRFDGPADSRFDGGPGRFDGPADSRFDGGQPSRFDGGPADRFDAGPGERFDGGPGDRFDGPGRFDNGPGPRFDERDQPGFGDGHAAAAAQPVPHPALQPFPPGVPTFNDPVTNQRPVNGTKPHGEPAPSGDRYGGPTAPVSPGAMGHDPGHGSPDATRGFPAAFPTPGDQPERPLWDLGDSPQGDQGRFDSFKPEATESKPAEQPTPKVRNGRVLMAVLTAAVLILVVPLGALWALGKLGGSDAPAFNPAVGTCVKQSGEGAVAANCGDQGAYKIISKVDDKAKCTDQTQPRVELPGSAANRVLCLGPAKAG
ncbi:LppU/SCO3897 family protein [Micromonospora sagamiensis]|uniref:Uncharacterized protein n=1 Tax=Micromonospora sagamiensis TaxID=47875 RepID=A0A562WPA1_9ACTN|nr:hypothetical protein [Micromonospora sagamiensis]TWJ31971.1 hypothetical protein JD81_05537 [Micromonospora sagamiensis]BCL14976.1 hypothetical protein GCM10017556_27150 [Micromonospora sagamiensis]